MPKRLVRSEANRMIYGVIGGLANYLKIDATILRLLFVIGLVLTAAIPLVIIYIAAVFIIPHERDVY